LRLEMANPDLFLEPLESNDKLADKIGEVIREAQAATDKSEKLKCLGKAEHLLLNVDNSGHLLDNFLDEMLEFTSSDDSHMRCFSANFIEKACKKDAEVLKKAITHLSYLLMTGNQSRGGVKVMKREINRAMPSNIAELRRKASKRQTAAEEPATKKKARGDDASGVPLDDDDYGDDEPGVVDGGAPIPDSAHQSAIDITAQFIYERLNPKLVANLVLISLVTLPDEMPAAFASSFTQIATAGTEQHRRHLARSMATQATAQELGPGAEQMRKEKLAKFMERQSARKDGVFIPPTPAVHVGGHQGPKPPLVPLGALPGPTPIPAVPKVKQQFNIFTDTRQLSREEMEGLFESCFHAIMKAERQAVMRGYA
ncbi:hypothetical protein TELCIR_10976, partial [Teladorsagia circumcincta]